MPEGEHVGGQPYSGLTVLQKRAVIELGLEIEEWDTATWQVNEDNMHKLKPAEKIAAIGLAASCLNRGFISALSFGRSTACG